MSFLLQSKLAPPPTYFPLNRGRFEVVPGLVPLTTVFGNGEIDHRLFQIDTNWTDFRASTMAARAERRDKYVLSDARFTDVAPIINLFLAERLVSEYPAWFVWDTDRTLFCRLTGEHLRFDSEMRLVDVESTFPNVPPYRDAFDALLSQVPEDLAVVLLPEGAPDANIALHVTAPSHWVPEEKIGASFRETHAPVPNFGRIAAASGSLLNTVLHRPPMVRFNWGIEFTDRLNLHPEPPPGTDAAVWNRRLPESPDLPSIYLRLERQVLWGLPACRVLLFSIRVSVSPVDELSHEQREALRQTLLSMPEDSRLYKGLPPETFTRTVQVLQMPPA